MFTHKTVRIGIVFPILWALLAFYCGTNDTTAGDREIEVKAPGHPLWEHKMELTKEHYGKIPNGQEAHLYTLSNSKGMTVKITNYGGIVTEIRVPDKKGNIEDVVLGFHNLEGYLGEHPYFGALIGRYANRIARGTFTLEGKTYKLALNNGSNHIHGGIKGFDKVLWQVTEIREPEEVGIKLFYRSKDGEEGYPGNLETTVTYTLNIENELKITYFGEIDKACPINLTHHSYFNLEGEGKGDILNHSLMVRSNQYLPSDDELIPTGEINLVGGTPLDFKKATPLGARIDQVKGGYDHSYLINPTKALVSLAARMTAPQSGRMLEVFTSEPTIHLYTGNFLDGSIEGKNGKAYQKHAGFCLEAQRCPDSPNKPDFPSTIYSPARNYHQITIYRFGLVEE